MANSSESKYLRDLNYQDKNNVRATVPIRKENVHTLHREVFGNAYCGRNLLGIGKAKSQKNDHGNILVNATVIVSYGIIITFLFSQPANFAFRFTIS